jgi:GAF domain-containing protein/multidrug efflux pump subunit AcrA (membrane-fusion protein)
LQPGGHRLEGAEEIVRRLKRLEMVHAVSRELNNSLDAEALLPRVLALVLNTLQAEAGSIWLLKGDKIVCEHAFGGAGDSIVGLELPRGAGVVGSVAEKRKPEIVLDAAQDKRHIKQVDDATGFVARSMITVPLVVRGECLGSLQILNKKGEGGRFTKDDAEVAQEISLDAAAAVRNARLMKAERRAAELRALLKMSREITSTLDLDRILTTAANILSGIVAFDRCAVALERKGALQVVAVSGKEKVDREDPGVKALEELLGRLRGIAATVYSSGPEAFAEDDPARAEVFRRHSASSGMKAALVVPLKDDSGAIGTLSMEAAGEDFLQEDQLELVETFANQVAVALRNADLYRQTPLVGMLQRRGGGSGIGGAGGGAWSRPWVRRATFIGGALLVVGLVPWPWDASGDAEVVPARRHHLRSETTLVVDRIDVEEGQAVEAGQVLGLLRSEDLEVRCAELEARIRSARADASRAEGIGRASDARTALDQVRLAEAQLAIARRRLEACTLRAPAKGWVLTRRPREMVGTVVESGRTVLEVAEAGKWLVEIRVPQGAIAPVRPGSPTAFSTPALPGQVYEGKVLAVAGAAEAGPEPVFVVTADATDPGGTLRSGMRGRGHVRLGTRLLGVRFAVSVLRWFRWKTGW